MSKQYFHIDSDVLGDSQLFSFHIYIYNATNFKYSPFLFANSPLTNDKSEFLSFMLDRGAEIAIDVSQKRTFLNAMDLEENEVPSLKEPEKTEDELDREKKISELETKKESEGSYNFQSEFGQSIRNNNFAAMIERARDEIITFSVRVNHTVSLARYLSEKLMTEDNFNNRIVAVSYFLTKNCDIKDEQSLGDLVCAAFFCHLGHTQLDFSLSHKPTLEMTEEEGKRYKKHAGLSQHLLNKSEVDLTGRSKQVIITHHERYDGSGYPTGKRGDYLDVLSLILGAVSHIFEFSEGKINGRVTPITSVINFMKNKTFSAGLEFEFGDKIYENIITLLSEDYQATTEKDRLSKVN